MTTIIVIQDERETDEFNFAEDADCIRIGRRPTNDVCIADRSVSGTHAQLTFDAGAVWIEDLRSTNGTYVNGDAIKRQRLSTGDRILVGKVQLQVELPAARTAAAPVLDDSLDASFDDMAIAAIDDDDELDDSMREALALYSDDSEPQAAEPKPVMDDDDDIDFSEDARLFAQSAQKAPAADSLDADIEDDRLPAAADTSNSEDPVSLSARAKAALGREPQHQAPQQKTHLRGVNGSDAELESDAIADEAPLAEPVQREQHRPAPSERAADTTEAGSARPLATNGDNTGPTHDLEPSRSRGAVIEIKNGAKSGQILPIDKPVTTLGRPGIQIAAIMRKPDGYFLMHIESDDSVDRPTLNADSIGDEPVLLHSGDELNVAGIDVEFMLS